MSLRSSRFAFLAAASSALVVPGARASAQALPVVRVVGPPNDAFAPVYWAQSTGALPTVRHRRANPSGE